MWNITLLVVGALTWPQLLQQGTGLKPSKEVHNSYGRQVNRSVLHMNRD